MGFEQVMYVFNEDSTFVTVNITVRRENPVTVSRTFSITVDYVPGTNATEGVCMCLCVYVCVCARSYLDKNLWHDLLGMCLAPGTVRTCSVAFQ